MFAEIATKEDIARLEARFDLLEQQIHGFYKGMKVTLASSMTGLTAIVAALLVIVR